MSKPLISSADPASARLIVWRSTLLPGLVALGIVALTLYAYRELPARPFAADDYQWLLNVRGLRFSQVVARAFDASAQSHFFRPLVWLLFWTQSLLFGLEPRGYHAVSLGLHLLNAGLLGALAWRLGANRWGALLAAGIVALHPALFEAVVWVSAQSELLAAALLLLMLHVWLSSQGTKETRKQGNKRYAVPQFPSSFSSFSSLVTRSLLATALLALALLAKESAVIGLPLLMLLGTGARGDKTPHRRVTRLLPYLLPTLLTVGYLWLQRGIEARNYLLQSGGYGLGPQLVLNPLRSLALIVAPLPGTEHADATWLLWLGAIVAGLVLFVRGRGGTRRAVLALLLTLLPTAPFVSPPDSRYLYLPVLAAALLVAVAIIHRPSSIVHRPSLRGALVLCSWFFVLLFAWFAAGETHAREGRFAAASGPGGSLWRLTSELCSADKPKRILIVEPPIATPHAEAIVQLACGKKTQPIVLGRGEVEGNLKQRTVVIAFPSGSAEVEQTRP